MRDPTQGCRRDGAGLGVPAGGVGGCMCASGDVPCAQPLAAGGRRACREAERAAGSGSRVPGEQLPKRLCSSAATSKPCTPQPRKPLPSSGSFLCPPPSQPPPCHSGVTQTQPPAWARTPRGGRVWTTSCTPAIPRPGAPLLRCRPSPGCRGDTSPRCPCQPAWALPPPVFQQQLVHSPRQKELLFN